MAHHHRSIFAHPPLNWLYTTLAILFEALRAPFWLIKYTIPSTRPVSQWTYKQAMLVRIARAVVYHFSQIEGRTPLSLNPGSEKTRFVVMNPGKPEFYRGPLLSNKDITPAKIGGTWYPSPYHHHSSSSSLSSSTTVDEERKDGLVCVHLHGGAFVTGDGRARATGYLAHLYRKHSGFQYVFCPQYRLSSSSDANGAFPAALQDAVTAYLYLLDLGIPASKIVLAGDSAGGCLAIAFLRYLLSNGEEQKEEEEEEEEVVVVKRGERSRQNRLNTLLPLPACVVLLSPWIAPKKSLDKRKSEKTSNFGTDYIASQFGSWGSSCYIGMTPLNDPHFVYIDHEDKPFDTKGVPVLANIGGAEVPAEDARKWVECMKGVQGNDVRLDVAPTAVHDVMLVGNLLGFEKEAVELAKSVGEFVTEVVGQ